MIEVVLCCADCDIQLFSSVRDELLGERWQVIFRCPECGGERADYVGGKSEDIIRYCFDCDDDKTFSWTKDTLSGGRWIERYSCKGCGGMCGTYEFRNMVMQPRHPRWDEFIDRLSGPEGCNFRDVDGIQRWDCAGGMEKSFSEKILKDMGVHSNASLRFFEVHGGHCDCEVVFNVAD